MAALDTANSLARAGLGVASGEPVTAITGGIGLLKSILSKDLQQRTDALIKRIADALPEGYEATPYEIDTAKALAQMNRVPVAILTASGNDASEATDLAFRRGQSLLTELDDAGRSRVRVMVQCYLRALSKDPEILRDVRSHTQGLTLKKVEALAESVDRQADNADALQQLLARWITRDVFYDPARDSRTYRDDDDLGPSQLLNAAYEVVPFRGREAELKALKAFRESDGPLATVVVEGEGGLGKTRLAMEAVQHARRDGWRAGFLAPEADPDTLQRGLAALAETEHPLFLVVDYAEDRPEEVATIAEAWNRDAPGPTRRLLLLVRKKDLLDGRLSPVGIENTRLKPAVDYLQSARVQPLATADLRVPPETRAAVFRDAQRHFAARTGTPLAGLCDPPATLTSTDKAYEHLGLPLYLHMAALASLDGPPSVRKIDLLKVVLDRNWAYISRLLADEPPLAGLDLTQDDLHDVLTVATLALAARPASGDEPDARACLAPTLLGQDLSGRQKRDLSAFLTATFSAPEASGAGVDALRPDALGEGLVYATLNREPGLLDAVLAMDTASAQSACTVLVRAALALADDAEAWMRQRLPMQRLREERPLAGTLLRAIPEQTVALLALAMDLAGLVIPEAPDEENFLALSQRAAAVGTHGIRLSAAGRRQEALAATQESVALYRRLAARAPDAFEPDLAMSLNNLGAMLSNAGRREEALVATQEAVDLYRLLAARAPDAFEPDLAGSLNNLGADLSNAGRREEALVATQEAVDLYRRLAARAPDAFEPDLAGSLSNLGVRLSNAGRREEALVATQEAVDLYRRLAARAPDAFEPDLAGSLSNLGNRLSNAGRREEALVATQEAVDLYRRLAARAPDAFEPNLAMSLNNLGIWLSNAGRREDALAATQEAVEIRRRLASRAPDAFEPDLAMSLNNLGVRLSNAGRREEALVATQEAVDLYRRLASRAPDAFEPNLATSLSVLGDVQMALNAQEAAVESYAESLQRLTRFVVAVPEAFRGLAMETARDYLAACEASGVGPDPSLLQPIADALGLGGDSPEE